MLGSLHQLKLPDAWQHQAVQWLRDGADVIVSAPTGAGKTYIFELIHQSGHLDGQAVYTVPTRALANDKYAEWKEAGWDVGIATGDVSENVHAPVLVATLETQLERLMRGDGPALLVIDEYQMIADSARGSHYEGAIALAPNDCRLLLLSGSVANPQDVADWMIRLGRDARVVTTQERPVPLEEAPWEALPQRMARHFGTFWPKFAAAVLLADLAPLLIFSPRRKDAQSIAKRLAEDLPQGEPLTLTHEQRAACGKELSSLLERRVAYHHSGLSYAARAGVIEPLAKAGQLRVIVATMGLAAGINFSVRSVHVAATTFHDGTSEHRLSPDELLQMYGRAGRRGLDEKGWVVTTRQSPTLHDARAGRLHRSSVLAWPMFLRVMKHAALRDENPFTAAEAFANRLFAKAPPLLGLEIQEPDNPPPGQALDEAKALFGLEATQRQVWNSDGVWEPKVRQEPHHKPLGDAWIATQQKIAPALTVPSAAAQFAQGLGRVCKIPAEVSDCTKNQGETRYGVQVPLGSRAEADPLRICPTKTLRKRLRLPRRIESVPLEELEVLHAEALAGAVAGGAEGLPRWLGTTDANGLVYAIFDLAGVEVPVYEDSNGRSLWSPLERVVAIRNETEVQSPGMAEAPRAPRPGSPIHSWRALGLVDASGVPTRRGEIFSFFHHGEGLAVAAALEDESYPVDELALHLANLRSGAKFDLPIPCGSERLAATCRAAYGYVHYHGYLDQGLPVDYGEGAAELLGTLLHPGSGEFVEMRRGIAPGDISRAYVEWLSLLRHITHAPEHEWQRWRGLQQAARETLKQHTATLRHLFHLDLPPLTNKQKTGKVRHWFMTDWK